MCGLLKNKLCLGAAAALLAILAGIAGAVWEDSLPPPRLDRFLDTSPVVLARDGQMLRAFAASDGTWRLPVSAGDVDPAYINMLLAFEDRRFYKHHGVDGRALIRAALTSLLHGRIVSGGSTLTMQAARLLEPHPRGISGKLRDIVQAMRLERLYGKKTILAFYLTLAPQGGNIEGVRAGSLAWFGHEPKSLTPAESALLVAIPQSPERLRPDRADRDALLRARGKVLAATGAGENWQAGPVPLKRNDFPMLAPHLAERLHAGHPGRIVRTTIDADLERTVMRILSRHMQPLPSGLSAAILVADASSGEVLAHVGSPDYFDARKSGMVDMTAAVRSPGSALKPFIYGLAAERMLVHPDTLIRDSARDFGGYAPGNFDDGFHGSVTMRQALQNSYNIPAVMVLERLGPLAFDAALRDAGVELVFDRARKGPLLPLALGGVGSRLADMATLYTALARGGGAIALRTMPDDPMTTRPFLGAEAAHVITGILRGTARPENVAADALPLLAYKTGTSYGYRDAWAFGFTPRHVMAVWLGYPEGKPCSGCTGFGLAAPLLMDIARELPPSPADASPVAFAPTILSAPAAELPPSLRRFNSDPLDAPLSQAGDPLELVFPANGSVLAYAPGMAVPLQARGGVPPYVFLVDDVPQVPASSRSAPAWLPGGGGFATIRLIDSEGKSASAEVFLGDAESAPAQ